MPKFMYHISIPETIGRLYGKFARVIGALFSIFISIAFVAMQIRVMSESVAICI